MIDDQFIHAAVRVLDADSAAFLGAALATLAHAIWHLSSLRGLR